MIRKSFILIILYFFTIILSNYHIYSEVCTRRDLGLDTNYPNLPINHDCDVINLKLKSSNDKKDSLKFKDIQIIINLLQKYYNDDKYKHNKNNNDNIKTLILKNNYLDDQSIKLISHLISSGLPPILNIDLVSTNISPLGLQTLAYSLRSDKLSVTSIDLRSNTAINDKLSIKCFVRSIIINECKGINLKIMTDLKKWSSYIEQDKKSLYKIGDLVSKRIIEKSFPANWVSNVDDQSLVEKKYGYITNIEDNVPIITWVNSNKDVIGKSEESICFLDLEERIISLDDSLTIIEVIIPSYLPDSNRKLLSISMIENIELPQLKSKVWLTFYETNDKINDEDIVTDGLSRRHKRIGLKRYSATDLDWTLDIFHHNTFSNKIIVECKGCYKSIKFDLRIVVNDENNMDEDVDEEEEVETKIAETKKDCGTDKECKMVKNKKPKTSKAPKRKNKIFSLKPSILLFAIKDFIVSKSMDIISYISAQIPPIIQYFSTAYTNFSNAEAERRQALYECILSNISILKEIMGSITTVLTSESFLHRLKVMAMLLSSLALLVLLGYFILKLKRNEQVTTTNIEEEKKIENITKEENENHQDGITVENTEYKGIVDNENTLKVNEGDDADFDVAAADDDDDDDSYTDRSYTDRSNTEGSYTDGSYTDNDSYTDDTSYLDDEYDVEDNLTAASTIDDDISEMEADNDIESIISEVVKIKDPNKEKLSKRKSTLQWIAYTLYHTVPDADTSMLTATIRKEQQSAQNGKIEPLNRNLKNSNKDKNSNVKSKISEQKTTKENLKVTKHAVNEDTDSEANNSDGNGSYDDDDDDDDVGDNDDNEDDNDGDNDNEDNQTNSDSDSDGDGDNNSIGNASVDDENENDDSSEAKEIENVENDEDWEADEDDDQENPINNDVKDADDVDGENDEDDLDEAVENYKKHNSMSEMSADDSISDSDSSSYSSSESSVSMKKNDNIDKKPVKRNIKITYRAPPIPAFNRKKLFRLDEKRRRLTIGKLMLPRIEFLQPYIAGEIIALLIQMDTEDLIVLLESPETLDKVVASAATLFYNKKKEMKDIKEKERNVKKLNKSKNTKRRRNEKNCIVM